MSIEDRKLVFDVEGKPELAEAIVRRLIELTPPSFSVTSPTFGYEIANVSTNWNGHGIHCGGLSVDNESFWDEHQLATLDDLYDPEFIAPQEQTYQGPVGRIETCGVEEINRVVQERLFELGAEWTGGLGQTVRNEFANVLFVDPEGIITWAGDIDCMSDRRPNDPIYLRDLFA